MLLITKTHDVTEFMIEHISINHYHKMIFISRDYFFTNEIANVHCTYTPSEELNSSSVPPPDLSWFILLKVERERNISSSLILNHLAVLKVQSRKRKQAQFSKSNDFTEKNAYKIKETNHNSQSRVRWFCILNPIRFRNYLITSNLLTPLM